MPDDYIQAYPTEWVTASDDEARALLIRDILSVKQGGKIRVYSGHAHTDMYNAPEFLDTARRVKKAKKPTIHVLTGPVVLVDDDRRNGILMLKEEGVIDQLLHRPTTGHHGHFRLVETDTGYEYYVEAPHEAGAGLHEHRCADLSKLPKAKVQELADGAKAFFDAEALILEEGPKSSKEDLPLLATVNGLRQLRQEAEARGFLFERLRPEEILKLPSAERLRIHS